MWKNPHSNILVIKGANNTRNDATKYFPSKTERKTGEQGAGLSPQVIALTDLTQALNAQELPWIYKRKGLITDG